MFSFRRAILTQQRQAVRLDKERIQRSSMDGMGEDNFLPAGPKIGFLFYGLSFGLVNSGLRNSGSLQS